MSMRQTVEADVSRLRKLLDDTNVIRLHLESDIESLKEELINLKKNHMTVRGISCLEIICITVREFGVMLMKDNFAVQREKPQYNQHCGDLFLNLFCTG